MYAIMRPTSLPNVEAQRSGHTPSSDEALSIEAYSTQLRHQRAVIEEEMLRLSACLQRIDYELRVNRSLLAPIRRLPAELLGEIFTYVVVGMPKEQWTRYTIQTLCGVCSTWRDVARDTPCLWTAISTHHLFVAREELLLDLQLELSGNLPLEIVGERLLGTPELSNDLLKRMEPHLGRVVEISLVVDCEGLLTNKQAQFNKLRALTRAYIFLHGDHNYLPGSLEFLTKAPSLQELVLDVEWCSGNDIVRFVLPPLPRLTHLSLQRYSDWDTSDVSNILSPVARTLQCLVVKSRQSCWLSLSHEDFAFLDMPALRSVDLQHAAHTMLQHINVPALETIIFRDVEYHNLTASLLQVLSHSHPRVCSLSYINVADHIAESCVQSLAQLEDLRQLCIEDTMGYWQFPTLLAALTCADDQPPLAPELKDLSLLFGQHCWMRQNADALNAMHQSRKEPRVCASRAVVALDRLHVDAKDKRT